MVKGSLERVKGCPGMKYHMKIDLEIKEEKLERSAVLESRGLNSQAISTQIMLSVMWFCRNLKTKKRKVWILRFFPNCMGMKYRKINHKQTIWLNCVAWRCGFKKQQCLQLGREKTKACRGWVMYTGSTEVQKKYKESDNTLW